MGAADSSGLPDLSHVQHLRKRALLAAAALMILALPFTASIDGPEAAVHETIEAVGFALILLCVLGRTWAALYIGGRKKHAVVSTGPYSLTRNPLYVFSVIGASGIGLATGSAVCGFVAALIAWIVFDSVVRREERWLRASFGPDYEAYTARVPRWWPRLSGWRDEGEVPVRPRLVLLTFRDAALFLLAVPLTELIDHLQAAGRLPVLLHLP